MSDTIILVTFAFLAFFMFVTFTLMVWKLIEFVLWKWKEKKKNG